MYNHSEQINELAVALCRAQATVKHALKDSSNPFFKSNYADLGSVWDACREALVANGLAVTQTMDVDGDRTMLVTTLMHTSGQWIDGRALLTPVKNDPQGMGSAITYMRRYSLAAIVGVVADDEDDDGNNASGKGKTATGNRPPTKTTVSTGKPVVMEAPKTWAELGQRVKGEVAKEAKVKELFAINKDDLVGAWEAVKGA
jgi:hypothetical protein